MKFPKITLFCSFLQGICCGDSSPNPLILDANIGYPFSEGIARVMRDRTLLESRLDGEKLEMATGRYGFINKTGQITIPLMYYSAGDFSEGLAPVAKLINDKIKYGFINHQGIMILPLQYDSAESFSEGLAAVKLGEKWGYVNHSGQVVIQPTFHRAKSFKEGVAFVEIGVKQWMFIDQSGQKLININDGMAASFSEGVSVVSRSWVAHNGEKIPIKSENVREFSPFGRFSEGRVTITLPYNGHSTDYGFANHAGNIIISGPFGNVYPFSEGLAAVLRDEDNKWGFINSNGEMIIPYKFESFGNIVDPPPIIFSEGLAFVKGGYIGHDGNFVIRMRKNE